MIATINPTNNQIIATFPALTEFELEAKLTKAQSTFTHYRHTPIADRTRHLLQAAEILDSEKQIFARLMTLEMGKPIEAARQEAAKCALACRYYAEHAEAFLRDEHADANSFIRYQP